MNIRKWILGALFLCIWVSPLTAEVEIYFAPGGGFHPENNQRTITLATGEVVPATLTNALLDLIGRAEEGGQIKIAMYAFHHLPTQEALIAAAKRGIKVKLILDAVAEWTAQMRQEMKKDVLREIEQAKAEGRVFDFQLKEIYTQSMVDRGRFKKMSDGTVIYGTMHEKFGVFYPKGSAVPLHAFCGSSNVGWSASEVYAENRVVFRHELHIARQLAEEFARLWNEFGVPVTSNCQSEQMIPMANRLGELPIISNAKPVDEENYERIDEELMKLMQMVDHQQGTIDVAIFSFTHRDLAWELINLAARYRKAQFRFLMDQTQIDEDENHEGVLGPMIEENVRKRKLKNVEVRYKWRSNAFFWDAEANTAHLIHWRNLLLHHKCLVVNRQYMGLGSYNWSSSAEVRNFENLMLFRGELPEQQKIINRFMAEYDFIWNHLKEGGATPATTKIPNPQVISGPYGRNLKKKILAAFGDPLGRKIMLLLDKQEQGVTLVDLQKHCALEEKEVLAGIAVLVEATLILAGKDKDGQTIYLLAD